MGDQNISSVDYRHLAAGVENVRNPPAVIFLLLSFIFWFMEHLSGRTQEQSWKKKTKFRLNHQTAFDGVQMSGIKHGALTNRINESNETTSFQQEHSRPETSPTAFHRKNVIIIEAKRPFPPP